MLRTAGGPVDVQHVADALQIHVTTVQLPVLKHAGTPEASSARGGPRGRGVGRPRLTYKRSLRVSTTPTSWPCSRPILAGRDEEAEAQGIADRGRSGPSRSPDQPTGRIIDQRPGCWHAPPLRVEIRSVLDAFGEVTVPVCAWPLAKGAFESPEVVRGIQQGLIQEVIDQNASALGHRSRRRCT